MSYPKIQFFLYLFLILIGSSIPGKSVPTVFAFTWDKFLHVIEYFFLGILGYRAYEIGINTSQSLFLCLESFSDALMKYGNHLFLEDTLVIMMLSLMVLV